MQISYEIETVENGRVVALWSGAFVRRTYGTPPRGTRIRFHDGMHEVLAIVDYVTEPPDGSMAVIALEALTHTATNVAILASEGFTPRSEVPAEDSKTP